MWMNVYLWWCPTCNGNSTINGFPRKIGLAESFSLVSRGLDQIVTKSLAFRSLTLFACLVLCVCVCVSCSRRKTSLSNVIDCMKCNSWRRGSSPNFIRAKWVTFVCYSGTASNGLLCEVAADLAHSRAPTTELNYLAMNRAVATTSAKKTKIRRNGGNS